MWASPWLWVAVSVLLLALATVSFVAAVAGHRRAVKRRMADPVEGKLTVTAANLPTGNAMFANYRLQGVVTAPGVPATAVEQRGIARVKKWPLPNRELLVLVDRAEPTRFLILWNRVATGRQSASEQTERLAQAMRGESVAGTPLGGTTGFGGQPPAGGQADAIAAAVRDSLSQLGVNADQVGVRASVVGGAGESATAVVIGVRDVPGPTGQPPPPGGAVELTLDVTRADGTRHIATAGALFSSPERRAQFGSLGAQLPVRVDPADQGRATIDYAAVKLI
jgi:hypothetical protein